MNLSVIRKICNEFAEDVEIEVGGGMRTLERVGEVLDLGVDYVVIGTAAVKAPGFLHDVCSEYGGSVIVSLDAKDGMVMTDGWTKNTGHSATDLAKNSRATVWTPSFTPTLAVTVCSPAAMSRQPPN